MSHEKDIKDFLYKSGSLSESMKEAEAFEPIHIPLRELMDRTSLYIEMMAAAFIKETEIKASEAELVVSCDYDKITFHFKKREDVHS